MVSKEGAVLVQEVELSKAQGAAYLSTSKETFFIGGIGSGKSFVLGQLALKLASIPRSTGFLGAPTLEQLRDSTWPQVQESFSKAGVYENEHYVVNIRPDEFGVAAFSKLSSTRIVTFKWGSYLLMDGLDKYNKKRGTEFDYILLDEFRDMREGVRKVLIARLRGRRFKALQAEYREKKYAELKKVTTTHEAALVLNKYTALLDAVKYRIFYCTTPPDDVQYLLDLQELENKELRFIFTTSLENSKNLPVGYVESLLEVYDRTTAEREVYGRLIKNKPKSPFAYNFRREVHVSSAAMPIVGEVVRLSFDFNVDPITCIAGHILPPIRGAYPRVRLFKEWFKFNGRTEELCLDIKAWLAKNLPDAVVYATGDAAGHKRDTAANRTNYLIIADTLGLNVDSQIFAPGANRQVKDSRLLFNTVLAKGEEVLLSPTMEKTIKDIEQVEVDEYGDILKSNRAKEERRADFLDCTRYFFDTWLRAHYLP